MEYKKANDKEREAELKVEDPTLPHGLRAHARMEKNGDCAGQDSSCQINAHLKVSAELFKRSLKPLTAT